MLKADQIPDAVARLADEAYYNTAGDNPTMSDEYIMKHAIAAAINAWPGMHIHEWQRPWLGGMSGTDIILPLTEPRDDDV